MGLLVAASLLAAAPRPAAAQGTDDDKALATQLFDDGVKKMQEGKCNEVPILAAASCRAALESFRKAYALFPALGALRNQAYVERGLGMIASAARDFREVARLAVVDPRPERQAWATFAREEAEKLATRVPHLTVTVPAARPQATVVKLDGAFLAESALGVAMEVDPGEHQVHVEAPDRKAFDAKVVIGEGETKTVKVDLAPLPAPPKPPPSPREPTAPSRVPAFVLGAAGIVGVGVGLGFGYASMRKKDQACDADGYCDRTAIDRGRTLGNVSTVVTSIGAATLVAGIALYVFGSRRAAEPAAITWMPYVGATGGGLALSGEFR